MRTSWLGLELSLRALQTQQAAINVTGHNIANANTPGYSRQGVRLTTTAPLDSNPGSGHSGMIGTGVQVADVSRYRDAFLDRTYRLRNGENGAAEQWVRAYDQLEAIFREPSQSGLRSQVDRFWNALQSVANNPAEAGTRAEVVEAGKALVATIHDIAGQLKGLQESLDESLVAKVGDVNRALVDVAALNQQIFIARAKGQSPNDLLDKRDTLLDTLARLTGATSMELSNGQVAVSIDGKPVVQGVTLATFNVQQNPDGSHWIEWEADGSNVTFLGGELGAIQGARDTLIPQYADYLTTWAKTFVGKFNTQHQAGYYQDPALGVQAGADFFSHTPAATGIEYLKSLGVAVEPWQVAAAAYNTALDDDSGNAWALLELLNEPNLVAHPDLNPAGSSLQGFYTALISELGVAARHSRSVQETTTLQLDQAGNQRLSDSGVNIDEEMIQLIRYEHAYAAAARVLNTTDELLNTLVNRVGLVGR